MSASVNRTRPRRAESRLAVARRLDGLRRAVDDARVRAHLRRTERDLRAADTDYLSVEQRRRRERHLDHLREYRERGAFPTNRVADERVPCFVGANGVLCALGYLMRRDGREDLVERVVDEDVTVRVENLDGGPVLRWLEANGFTRAEAARIQPTYPTGVNFATTCGPVPCWVAGALVSLVGLAVFAAAEIVGYRVASDLFPDNALKRRSALAYVTVVNLFLAPLAALLLYALFP